MSASLPEFEYIGTEWPAGADAGASWDHGSVASVMIQALPQFIQIVHGTEPLGIYPLASHARNESAHNVSMTFAYVLARAAYGKDTLSLLDWGGALGHYAIMAARLMPEVPLRITIKDRPELCRIGRELLPAVAFETADEACFGRTYDLVMASASLQYAADWRLIFGSLARSTRQWMFVTRMPVVRQAPSFVVLQRAQGYGYQADFPSWVFNRDEVLEHARALGLVLEREFIAGHPTAYSGQTEASETQGFLFRRGS
jgi:putative methyltransferase (TIGR04325 family)